MKIGILLSQSEILRTFVLEIKKQTILKKALSVHLKDGLEVKRFYSVNVLITFAGTPATKLLFGTSLVTTAPAATTTLLPIVTPGVIVTLPPIYTSLPIVTGSTFAKRSRRPAAVKGWLTV